MDEMYLDDEMKTTPEDRQYMAERLVDGFEEEQGSDIGSLIAAGTFDRDAVLGLIREGMKRVEDYIISS